MLFPDGRVPRGRWRWQFWGYVAVGSTFAVSLCVDDVGAFTNKTITADRGAGQQLQPAKRALRRGRRATAQHGGGHSGTGYTRSIA